MKHLIFIALLFLGSDAFSQKKKVLDLKGLWKFTIGDRKEYALVDYNDLNWESISVPSPWEDEGFANYNGYAWYRYAFNGTKLQDYRNLLLNLGYIDDVHEVYLNGELLGFKGSFPPDYYTAYNALNEYTIPENHINRKGLNIIAVKIYDLVEQGGIVKGNEIGIWHKTEMSRPFLSLAGVWKFTTSPPQDWKESDYNDYNWDDILVPSFWRSKHIKWSAKSSAWYRKEFQLPNYLKNKDLFILLGLIDDFDKTYLNGVLIGSTKDDLPFGESRSYREFRVYKVSRDLFNQNGLNILAVQVEDLGGNAGIYKGPIGITSKFSPN